MDSVRRPSSKKYKIVNTTFWKLDLFQSSKVGRQLLSCAHYVKLYSVFELCFDILSFDVKREKTGFKRTDILLKIFKQWV